jgi:hypothetical protein
MTEAEWLAATDPTPMLAFLRGKASDRKLRLFAVACYRLNHWVMADTGFRKTLEAAERWADGQSTFDEVNTLADWMDDHPEEGQERGVWWPGQVLAMKSAEGAALSVFDMVGYDFRGVGVRNPDLLRCLFGNPFHSVSLDPSCRTSTVLTLAQGVYADRAFDRLPILADALQDAGCDNADVLAHCRGPGPHVRGCWVVDLLLGKS